MTEHPSYLRPIKYLYLEKGQSIMNDIIIKERTRDFYFYTLFGVPYLIAKELSEDDRITLCAHRAYADLSRTIDYSFSSSWLDKNKKTDKANNFIQLKISFKNDVRNCIVKHTKKLLLCASAKSFDFWHKKCCDEIIKIATGQAGLLKSNNSFTYGQAQKWVNMTLKYMDITGFWEDKLCQLREFLHLPVDSYIMKAASDIGVNLPRLSGEKGKYSESLTKKWSNWNDTEYEQFVDELKIQVKDLSEWEESKWIEIAWMQSTMNPKNQK